MRGPGSQGSSGASLVPAPAPEAASAANVHGPCALGRLPWPGKANRSMSGKVTMNTSWPLGAVKPCLAAALTQEAQYACRVLLRAWAYVRLARYHPAHR